MSWRGAKPVECSPVPIRSLMKIAEVKPSQLARILGLPKDRVHQMLRGAVFFTHDQLSKTKAWLQHNLREKGILPKLDEKAEREQDEERGLPEQFFAPKVLLKSCPRVPGDDLDGGYWLIDAETAALRARPQGIIQTIMAGPPEYQYIVGDDQWETARDLLLAKGFNVVNRDAAPGWCGPKYMDESLFVDEEARV